MRVLLPCAALLSLCAFAQSPTEVFQKAPPKIDEALRARVAIFFQAHVDGKFRQAEQVVHEDSKDAFYNSEKSRYISYEITQILYSENFTKATVVTPVEIDWYTARMGKLRVKPPMKSLWKYDAGQWWWYAPPRTDWETPFGNMNQGATPQPGVAEQTPKIVIPDMKTILDQVRVERTDVRLSSWQKSEDAVEIYNGMPGDLTLAVEPLGDVPGLTVTLDKTQLHAKEKARVTFRYEPLDRTVKTTKTIRVTAAPINQTYVFTLTFAVPPEAEKYLQKK